MLKALIAQNAAEEDLEDLIPEPASTQEELEDICRLADDKANRKMMVNVIFFPSSLNSFHSFVTYPDSTTISVINTSYSYY